MRTVNEGDKLSLAECRKILGKEGEQYSGEELLKIRNWLYHFTEITKCFLESKTKDELIDIKEKLKSRYNRT